MAMSFRQRVSEMREGVRDLKPGHHRFIVEKEHLMPWISGKTIFNVAVTASQNPDFQNALSGVLAGHRQIASRQCQ
jgi:hypothetical protein